jgi:hypothetical protein
MPTDAEIRAYYTAALSALRFVEARQPTGRRFGADADARWSSLRGELTTADRLDLLIRDADAQWPEAFGARTVFAKRAVAEDEPFGADWQPLDPVDAEALWRAALGEAVAQSPRAALEGVARAWGMSLHEYDAGTIGATDRLIVVGPSAIASTIEAFVGRSDLDWAEQVTVLATPPAHRQLGALAGALLRSTKPTRVWNEQTTSAAKEHRLVRSSDADPADAARAEEIPVR